MMVVFILNHDDNIAQSSPQHSLVGELMNKFGFSDILEYQVNIGVQYDDHMLYEIWKTSRCQKCFYYKSSVETLIQI